MADNRLKTKAIHNWMNRAGWYSPATGPIHVQEKSSKQGSVAGLGGAQDRKQASHVINNQAPNKKKKRHHGLSGKARQPRHRAF